MTILNGKEIAAEVLSECREKVEALQAAGITPGLAVVIVGDDPASHVYVNSKVRTCGDLGIHSRKIELPAEATQEQVLQAQLMGPAPAAGMSPEQPEEAPRGAEEGGKEEEERQQQEQQQQQQQQEQQDATPPVKVHLGGSMPG